MRKDVNRMGARGWMKRVARALLVVVAAAGTVVCAELVAGEARVNAAPGLAIAVFGIFLTSMAIIVAFSIDGGSRWPTPWEMLGRARVPLWFLVALASVIIALLSAEIDSSFLSSLALTVALAAIPLASWSLWSLISLSSDRGRWGLVVDLLARSILEVNGPTAPREPDLGDIDTDDHVPAGFLAIGSWSPPQRSGVSIEAVPNIFREYADQRDTEAIVRLIDEVRAAGERALTEAGSTKCDRYLAGVDTVQRVQRLIFEQLATRIHSGQLGEEAARVALVRAGQAVIDTAGRALWVDIARDDPGVRRRIEVLVARHLAALCRTAGAMTRDTNAPPGHSEGQARRAGAAATRLDALRATCTEIQQAVRWAVDPDPPGMKMPHDHPWREGLSDPESVLVWLWSAAESPSGPFGVGLYATCEILTGRKFFGSYWEGLDVFTEIERRLGADAEESPVTAEGRAAIDRAGGLPLLALELGSIRLAATSPRAAVDGAWGEDDRHVACNLFLAGGGYKPAGREPVADLSWLLTDRADGSLWTAVSKQLSRLSDSVLVPPLVPLYRNPEACALAVCLRLTPLEKDASEDALGELRAFVAGMPRPLLARTALLGLRLTSTDEVSPPSAAVDQERALIEAARFVCRIVPGSPPSLPPAPVAVEAPMPAVDPAVPPGFGRALDRIAASESGTVEVDLIQCDRRWLDEWAPLRARLDSALLALALGGRGRVRRIVLFDLPAGADRASTRLHYRWSSSLAAAVGCFEQRDDEGRESSPYQVRQLILPRIEGAPDLPTDRMLIREAADGDPEEGEAEERFDELWSWISRL
jgi:hypothetical protein